MCHIFVMHQYIMKKCLSNLKKLPINNVSMLISVLKEQDTNKLVPDEK